MLGFCEIFTIDCSFILYQLEWTSLMAQTVKNPPAM